MDPVVFILVFETFVSNSKQPNIAIISVAVFLRALKLLGFSNFKLCLHSSDIQVNSTKLAEAPNFSNVSSDKVDDKGITIKHVYNLSWFDGTKSMSYYLTDYKNQVFNTKYTV